MRISYDYGHLEGGQDGSANGIVYEYAEVRKYGAVAIAALRAAGHECIDCTAPNGTPTLSQSLQYRVNKANASGSKLHICFHINAFNGSAYGAEVEICSTGGQAEKYANAVLNEICALGFARRGVKTPSLYVTKYTSMPAILIEPFFCDNANDCKIYDATKVGNAIAKAIISIAGGTQAVQPTPTTKHPIMGKADLTKEQIVKYILDNNPNPQIPVPIDEFISYYFEEGAIEGVRPDYSACQSILETGCFKFGNDVKPEQCNYSGIGTVGNGVAGASFSSAREGVKAQIQHLFGYASTENLKGDQCVDPRYSLLTRGIAPNLEDLSGRWAADSEYATKILSIYTKIKSIKVDSNPAEPTPVQNIFTYPNNAQVVGDDLYIRNENGEKIEGRYISDGDHITVLDVSYSKGLILCEYPTNQGMRSGYVKNIPSLIKYYYQGQYHNGSTPEKTYQESSLTTDIGELSSYENATPLYRKDGHLHVVYNVGSKENVKSGYCKYDGEFTKF